MTECVQQLISLFRSLCMTFGRPYAEKKVRKCALLQIGRSAKNGAWRNGGWIILSLNGPAHTFSIIYVMPFVHRLELEYDVTRRFSETFPKEDIFRKRRVIVYTLVWVAKKANRRLKTMAILEEQTFVIVYVDSETNVNVHVWTKRVVKTWKLVKRVVKVIVFKWKRHRIRM